MTEFTTGELMAVEMSRHLSDGEVAIMGAYSALPMLACRLAQLTHAPNLTYIAGGSGAVNPRLEPLLPSSCDDSLLRAEAILSLDEVIDLEGRPEIDVFFAGGLQIDSRGNCNLVGVGPYDRLKLRGPGSVGLPFLSRAGRFVIYTMGHDARTLVESVDFVSGPGVSEEAPGGGPSLIVTPRCVIEFAGGRPHLRTVHPGHSVDEVVENTGFELVIPDDLGETEPPSRREAEIMRSLDPLGVARGT
jgi:glutaconate CoA-transferase subunit B